MSDDFQVVAKNANAPFTLKLHRGDGMTLLAMDWKDSKPPRDFVGFALEYKEPDGDRFWTIKNRINFPNPDGSVNKERTSSRLSPVQKFRWVHFPENADKQGEFTYRVTPVFMNVIPRTVTLSARMMSTSCAPSPSKVGQPSPTIVMRGTVTRIVGSA